MNFANLPFDVHLHIFQFLSDNEQIKLATLRNRKINWALRRRVLEFYDNVYKFLPCGIWFSPTEQKIYHIMFIDDLILNIDYYPMFTKKQLCFNKKKGLQQLKNFQLLKRNEKLYFNKKSWRITAKKLKKIGNKHIYKNNLYNTIHDENTYFRRINVRIALKDTNVIVKKYNRNNHKFLFEYVYQNNKLISKSSEDISEYRWSMYYFCDAFY